MISWTVKPLQTTKHFLFTVSALIIVLILFFILEEIVIRMTLEKRLIVQVEENGLFHFKPNQEGWYTRKLESPRAGINNVGARGEDVDLSLFTTTKKYIFLGDSFTFGWDLQDMETLPYHLQQESNFNNSITLNYGNGGFGVDHMVATYDFFKDYFREQDTVLMIMVYADFSRPMTPYQRSWVKEAFWVIKEKSSFLAFLWANFRHVLGLLQNTETRSIDEEAFTRSQEKLLAFHAQLQKDNINLVYVFYEYNHTRYSDRAKDFCEEHHLFCITNVYDSIDSVRKQRQNIFTLDDAHPSNASNLALAKDIANFINIHHL